MTSETPQPREILEQADKQGPSPEEVFAMPIERPIGGVNPHKHEQIFHDIAGLPISHTIEVTAARD